jgi:hypothetical protein
MDLEDAETRVKFAPHDRDTSLTDVRPGQKVYEQLILRDG